MKKFNKTSFLIIIIGLIVSVIALETLPVDEFHLIEKEETTSQRDDQENQEDTSVVSKSVIALPFSLEFQIDPELFLLNIIPEKEGQYSPKPLLADFIKSQQKVLKILLRRIISPNAP